MIILEIDPKEVGWVTVNKIMALLEGVEIPDPQQPPDPPADPGDPPDELEYIVIQVDEKHARKEIIGFNKKGFPIMGNLTGQRAEAGELYWCKPEALRADGGGHYWEIIARNRPDPSTVMAGQFLDNNKVTVK